MGEFVMHIAGSDKKDTYHSKVSFHISTKSESGKNDI